MIQVKDIQNLVEEKIEGTDVFVVNIDISSGNKILVELDSDSSLSIADCVSVSRHVEHNLDREAEDFALQVSSAGADQPLRLPRQYSKNIGRKLSVVMNDGTQMEGLLKDADGENVMLEVTTVQKEPGKKKQTIVNTETIPLNGIEESKIIISI